MNAAISLVLPHRVLRAEAQSAKRAPKRRSRDPKAAKRRTHTRGLGVKETLASP